jgi:NAD(P)-dependent dehydrogenase (short-subunit alcohol dehydrogenase family)
MSQMICLVTGANAGMGYWITTGLAKQGARVVMVCRNAEKGRAARDQVAQKTGNPHIDVLIADLASQQSIRHMVQTFQERYAGVHLLVNNAGAHIQQRQVTAEGIEMNLMLNHLSSFLLTTLLLDMVRASAPARIVNVASNAMTPTIDLTDLQSERSFAPWHAYGQAKLAMVLTTYALARRLAGTGVTVNALHPGLVGTDIVAAVAPPIARPFLGLIKRFLLTPAQGAQLHCTSRHRQR